MDSREGSRGGGRTHAGLTVHQDPTPSYGRSDEVDCPGQVSQQVGQIVVVYGDDMCRDVLLVPSPILEASVEQVRWQRAREAAKGVGRTAGSSTEPLRTLTTCLTPRSASRIASVAATMSPIQRPGTTSFRWAEELAAVRLRLPRAGKPSDCGSCCCCTSGRTTPDDKERPPVLLSEDASAVMV